MDSIQHKPTVATVVEPAARMRLDAAGHGCFVTVHTDSVPEAIQAVRERPVDAVLISPGYVPPEEVPRLASLVRGFPGVPTVAVISRHDARSSERLLELGASGVRRIVDLTARDGWCRLRDLIARPATPTSARILARVMPELEHATTDCEIFFQTMIRLAPGVGTVRALTRHFGIRPSTFMSRFFRARLPSPKRYLAATRILYAAALFEVRGLSIADIAYRLEYSSPQSFGRHLRSVVGLSASVYREKYTLAKALDEYCDRLIVPCRPAFRTFHPLNQNGMATLGQIG